MDRNYILDNQINSLNSTILSSIKYCFNKCYNDSNLNEYKKCYSRCEYLQKNKQELIDSYLIQIEQLFFKKDRQDGNIDINQPIVNDIINSPYILPEYYYKTNLDIDMANQKQSSGSVFGRNK
jgi:hypothetical protein